MKLLNKVKDRLEKEKGFDFASEYWTDEMLVLLYDVVYAAEKEVKNLTLPDVRVCFGTRKILGKLTFDIEKENNRYKINGGTTKNNGFGWANREQSYKTKPEAINAIIETVKGIYIEDAD